MVWYPPDDYRPIRGVVGYLLRMEPPSEGTAEEKLIMMIREWKPSTDVGMTREMAQDLIDRRLVPTGLYPSILSLCLPQREKPHQIGD